MSEPREFWIIKETMGQMCPAQALSEKMHDDDIHVIEYSAYETLRTENERLSEEWKEACIRAENVKQDWLEAYRELQSEREKNAELIKALTIYACLDSDEYAFMSSNVARQTLAKLGIKNE